MALDLENENSIRDKKLQRQLFVQQMAAGLLVVLIALGFDLRSDSNLLAEHWLLTKGVALGVIFYSLNLYALAGFAQKVLGLSGQRVSARGSAVSLVIKNTFFFAALIVLSRLGQTLFLSFLLGFTGQMIVGMFLALLLSTRQN